MTGKRHGLTTGIILLALLIMGLSIHAQDTTIELELDDIEDVLDHGTDALSRQMDGIEEGDGKHFTSVTDEDIGALAVGDIYRSGQTFFKVISVKASGNTGGRFTAERMRGRLDPSSLWNRVSGEGPVTIATRLTMLDRFLSGGVVMYPIGLLLLLLLIVSIRSLFYYRISLHCPQSFTNECSQAIEAGNLKRFEELSVHQKGLLAHTCRVMVANIRRLTIDEIKSRIEAEAIHEVGRLSFPLRVMNLIAVAAPLCGLLGTVLGMITCFDSLAGEAATQSKSMAMAAGIKQALLTTAFGLIVALPALFMFFVFNYRMNQIANLCAVSAEELVHEIAVLGRDSLLSPEAGDRSNPASAAPDSASS
jgi:biopolymer transport protein ExbB